MTQPDLLDLDAAREVFDSSRDFTIGIEEEFAILDPGTLDLVDRYPELKAACSDDPVLADSAVGELIASEVEIRSGRAESMADALERQVERRRRLFALAGSMGVSLASMGTHPWADYLDQQIIDTPHYQRLKRDLGYVAQRNNTWSLHAHVGIRGADRAIAVCDRLRQELPFLLAISSNSPFLDNRDTGLASVRTEIFTRTFPRCGIPECFGDWRQYADFIDTLRRVGSIVEATQLWWSVRPHHAFGTVEVRICDAQPTARESTAMAGLIVAVIAQTAVDIDAGRWQGREPRRDREIEENLWRAIRYGREGKLIDFEHGREVETERLLDQMLERTSEVRRELGIDIDLPPSNGSSRARAALEDGSSIAEVYRAFTEQAERSFSGAAAH